MNDFRSRTSSLFLAAVLFLTVGTGVASAQQPGSAAAPDTNATSRERLSASFAEVAKAVEGAVVSIDTKGKAPEVTTRGEARPGDSDEILDFFRRQLPRRPVYSVGSGFVVDPKGYIITNAHVVDDAAKIVVKFDSGREYQASVVGTDEETDIAILKIETDVDLPTLKLGDSDEARVGDWVLAVGSPFGLARTVTAGIISQTKRETPSSSPFQKFIQTDAAINRGNSGGPLVDMRGRVIGVNSQIATSTGDYNGVGFALPSNEAASVYEQIVKFGRVRRGYMGVALESVKSEFAKVYNLPDAKGAIVTEVSDKTSPAGTAGIKAGDVIVGFDGKQVESAQDLIAKVAGTMPERNVQVEYLREVGTALEKRTAQIRLAERERKSETAAADEPQKRPLRPNTEAQKPFGLTLSELTPALASTYGLDGQKGLIVRDVNPSSYIADVKMSNGTDALVEGHLIQRINRVPVTTLTAFSDIVAKLKVGDAVVLEVLAATPRGGSPQLKIVQFTVQ